MSVAREKSVATMPPLVSAVLDASDGDSRPWQAFVRRYSRVMLHVASRCASNYDERMNLYAHVLGEIHRDDFRKLRAYQPTNGARFTTWLAVVARRLCVDHVRSRYGRKSNAEDQVRRRLEDLIYEELDPEKLGDGRTPSPDAAVQWAEVLAHLEAAITSLPQSEQLILNLRFVDGRTAGEIAETLGLTSQWQVYRRLRAILKTLEDDLHGRGIHEPTLPH